MPTPAQTALAEGFSALLETSGVDCLFGATSVAGVLGQLRPDYSRLLGAPDRTALLCFLTATLAEKSVAPKRGDVVLIGSVSHTVCRRPDQQPSGITEIIVAPTA